MGLLEGYFNAQSAYFIGIAHAVLNPTNPDWACGDGMWSWANASLYTKPGKIIAESNNIYKFGQYDDTTWYIFNADQVRMIAPYRER